MGDQLLNSNREKNINNISNSGEKNICNDNKKTIKNEL